LFGLAPSALFAHGIFEDLFIVICAFSMSNSVSTTPQPSQTSGLGANGNAAEPGASYLIMIIFCTFAF
jgi:hypothetical protein